MPKKIFIEGKKYTFSDYFEMSSPTEEIVAEFGYLLLTQLIKFPQKTTFEKEPIANIRDSYYSLISKISLNSEIAKRELMIAPILHAALRTIDAKLNIEYLIEVDDKLSGTIDYLFRST